MTIIAVTGLYQEARIAKRAGLLPVISACDGALLTERLRAVADQATAVISFGIAGSLSPLLKPGDIIIGSHVVAENEHYACDAAWMKAMQERLPKARQAIIAGADEIISHITMKKTLMGRTGAHLVDMESHIAARFAAAHGLPFAALRTISDGNERTLPPAALVPLRQNGKPNLIAVLKCLAADPDQFGELIQTARESGKAFKSLRRSRRSLGLGLRCPYLG